MTKNRIVAIAVAVTGMAAAVVVAFVSYHYEIMPGAPRVSWATVIKPETRVQIVLNPLLGREVIARVLNKTVGAPPWVARPALPYQVAALGDADFLLGDMKMTLFINEKRLGPVIRDKMNGFALPFPWNQWFIDKMASRGRGALVREGAGPMDSALLRWIASEWKTATPGDPLRADGNHLIEAVLDNRDGGAAAILGSLAAARGIHVADRPGNDFLKMLVTGVRTARLQVDLTPDNALTVHLAMECAPPAGQLIAGAIESGYADKIRPVMTMVGVPATGKCVSRDNVVEGDYAITDLNRLLVLLGV